MKFTLNILKRHRDHERGWPHYLFGGHVRTSTLVLIVALVAVGWVYNTYRAHPEPPPQVIPPGYIPNPEWTYVEKGRVDQSKSTVTVTVTPTTTTPTTTTPSPTTTTTTTPPPPFQLPCPPFCTRTTTTPPKTTSPLPQPGPGPVPTSSAPAR